MLTCSPPVLCQTSFYLFQPSLNPSNPNQSHYITHVITAVWEQCSPPTETISPPPSTTVSISPVNTPLPTTLPRYTGRTYPALPLPQPSYLPPPLPPPPLAYPPKSLSHKRSTRDRHWHKCRPLPSLLPLPTGCKPLSPVQPSL